MGEAKIREAVPRQRLIVDCIKINGRHRVADAVLGIGFVLIGMFRVFLGYTGKETTAVITSIRREGGERGDSVPGRYTYHIGYSFTLSDGKKVDGFAKHIGDATYMKADGTSTVRVKYYAAFPYLNALERDTGLDPGQIILVATGVFLIFVMNGKYKKRGGNRKPQRNI